MNYSKLELFLSRPRLSRFLNACDRSEAKCLKLYDANMKVSQAFYPVLNLFEVCFRNVCNTHLSNVFESSDWMIKEKDGFMSNSSLEKSKYFLKASVLNAENNILRSRRAVTPEKIVGELPFGFWTSLFDSHHFALIEGCVLRAFPYKPTFVNRKVVDAKLTKVREFRNRVYHNEPICFNGTTANFSYAYNIRRDIYELLEWMDPELPGYVRTFDNIKTSMNSYIAE